MKKKLLITGMSGLIGGAVHKQLEGKYELSALNRSDVPGVKCLQADIADLDAIRPAFEGQDMVVHLAAFAKLGATWDKIHSANVIGTYNVFEASRCTGVKRIVSASSGATIAGWEREFPYKAIAEGDYNDAPDSWDMMTHESVTRPIGLYGASKIWGEALARHFTDTTDLSILCLRIGGVNAEDKPLNTRQNAIWCSQRDIAQLIEKCIEAPDSLKYDIFYGVSNNKRSYRDITHAREVVGFEPQDSADKFL